MPRDEHTDPYDPENDMGPSSSPISPKSDDEPPPPPPPPPPKED